MDDALQVARNKFAEYLQSKHPEMAWKPSPEFMREHMVKSKREEPKTLDSVVNSPELYQVHLDLELNADSQKEVEKEAREFQVHQRMLLLGRGLGGLVLLLGAIATWIRVDEWTKGYLTLPLRALIIALAIGGIIALWWLV
jgi:hypothetical protein